MKRREMLAALATAPVWIQRAFAGDQCSAAALTAPGKASAALATAYRAAQRGGRPLLVFVIPENAGQRWDRGAAFGEWLNHGSAEQLRPLALVEVACARMKVLRRLVPSVPEGEPIMVLVDTDQSPPNVRFLDRALPTSEDRYDPKIEDVIDRRIAALSALLSEATVGDAALTARRFAQNQLTLTARERAALPLEPPALELALVERAAPVLMAQATGDSPRAVGLRARLDELVKKKVRDQPPRGARWARSRGCGVDIEGEDSNIVVGCGMGHTPERSQRFLYFYSGQPFGDQQPDEE